MHLHLYLLAALSFSLTCVFALPNHYPRAAEEWTLRTVSATVEGTKKEPGIIVFELSRGSKKALAGVRLVNNVPKDKTTPMETCSYRNPKAVPELNLKEGSIVVAGDVFENMQQKKDGKGYHKLTYKVSVTDGDEKVHFEVGFDKCLEGKLGLKGTVEHWESTMGKETVKGTE